MLSLSCAIIHLSFLIFLTLAPCATPLPPFRALIAGRDPAAANTQSNTSVLTHFDSENYTVPLDLTAAAADSSLFQSFPTDVVHILSSQPVTMNNHMLGVSPSTFYC